MRTHNKYIRFTTQFTDEDNEMHFGVFHAIASLRDTDQLAAEDDDVALEAWRWFARNLKVPNRFTDKRFRSRPKIGVCWMKDDAHEHLRRLFVFKALLEQYDHVVDIVKSDRPGVVIYEDEHQIVAVPDKTDRSLYC